ncbi:Folate-binding protein [Glarea lozoyensis ATCC 20868]|uniref:Iron-sulfur cluster assembly factor IBA57 homolog, mitochondrial n=1 Tax=Glarea lozoyensis (strain ATCC 20868 / MF5171) TaxID=1116229 RepID=S3D7J3_GLAL2|nr:Folate-binding protein [Glarea lozoyensis ATCC 20868]EPE33725.1 Folate-binding protein [Glarea lozoyensis ATCC 20868]
MKLTRLPRSLFPTNPSICPRCLPHRTFTTTTTTPPSKAYAPLPSRALLSLTGPDATAYLQGALTANLSVPRSTGFYAAFLNAPGRVLYDVFVYPRQDGWFVECDSAEVEALGRWIRKYKLRRKFEVKVIEGGEWGVWGAWGGDPAMNEGGVTCPDERAPGFGHRLLLPGSQKPELDAPEVEEDSYTVRRYMSGIPEGQQEILKESALPLESNIELMGGIDFRKGCYVGQELTIRTHHTGVVRKRILPTRVLGEGAGGLEGDKEEWVFKGEDVGMNGLGVTSAGRKGRWIRGIGNLGLGLWRLDGLGVVELEVGGRKVRVEPFVPGWFGEREGKKS